MKAVNFLVCAIAAGLLIGCASSGSSSGVKASSKAADGLAQVTTEMDKGLTQIDATVAALNNLVNAPGDLKKQYSSYTKDVNKLDSASKSVAKRNQAFKARAKEYLDKWEKDATTIKSETIRQISVERRAAVAKRFETVKSQTAAGRAAFTPLMEELRDIEMYLSNDLTSAGVAACKPIADQANSNAAKVKEALTAIGVELKAIQSELTAATAK